MLIGNRRRFGDKASDATECLPCLVERTAIWLMVDAIERYEIDVVRFLQLLQDVERTGSYSRVGRVGETLREEEQTWSSGHRRLPRFERDVGAGHLRQREGEGHERIQDVHVGEREEERPHHETDERRRKRVGKAGEVCDGGG